MSDDENTPPARAESKRAKSDRAGQESAGQGSKEPRRPSRLRRFFLRHVPLTIAGAAVVLLIALTGLYFWASSSQGERLARRWLTAKVEAATGGRVQIASFHWHLLHLEADAGGVTIHGREGPGEAPYAHIGNLRVQLSVVDILIPRLFSPRVLLRSLDISRPSLHLIVYPDGATNQPVPRRPRKPGKPLLETLFNLQAGHVSVEQGAIDYDDRAASFDFENRYAPLDLSADDVSVLMRYAPAAAHEPESYRIEVGATDLNLRRGGAKNNAETAHGRVQATLDLTRTAAYLRSLRLTTWEGNGREGNGERHALEITGALVDFAHPRWQAKVVGDFDMGLLDPATGFPYTPEGIAHVSLAGAGAAGQFRADGSVHVEDGSYIGTGVQATGLRLDARVHADPSELLIGPVVARLRQGGQIDGTVALTRWLTAIPGAAAFEPAEPKIAQTHARRSHGRPIRREPVSIPVSGKVTARFNGVSLDEILGMVSKPPFERLGVNTRVDGQATAAWSKGDARTVVVGAALNLSLSGQSVAGENPASGSVNAIYTQRDGSVDLRNLSLTMPGSRLQAQGRVGVYPVSSPTSITVELHSSNLGDFDTVLRSLGLR
ncbi:MAG: AsmA family protein, partial [Terracidiphilus sp.]